MYCKICNEHLYKEISWVSLFKWNYVIHVDCEESLHPLGDFVVVPMLDQIVHYDYVFPVGHEQSDTDYLFTHYVGERLDFYLEMKDWSIIVFLDDIIESDDLPLVVQLGSGMVIMLSYFDEMILHKQANNSPCL